MLSARIENNTIKKFPNTNNSQTEFNERTELNNKDSMTPPPASTRKGCFKKMMQSIGRAFHKAIKWIVNHLFCCFKKNPPLQPTIDKLRAVVATLPKESEFYLDIKDKKDQFIQQAAQALSILETITEDDKVALEIEFRRIAKQVKQPVKDDLTALIREAFLDMKQNLKKGIENLKKEHGASSIMDVKKHIYTDILKEIGQAENLTI